MVDCFIKQFMAGFVKYLDFSIRKFFTEQFEIVFPVYRRIFVALEDEDFLITSGQVLDFVIPFKEGFYPITILPSPDGTLPASISRRWRLGATITTICSVPTAV